MMWRKLFNAPWPDETTILPLPAQRQATQSIYGYWRSRGWQVVLGEIVLAVFAYRWHETYPTVYDAMLVLIALAYTLGVLVPHWTVFWLLSMVALFLLHGMLMAGMGAVTALFFMVPYTFAGMLLSGQRRMWVQGVCVAAFWLSLMYGIIPFAPQLHPPLIFSVCYNLLLAAFTFQTLRFLNQLAVEINTIYVAEQMRQQSRQFLMSVSHELRTPLNSVLGFARMLKKSELDETQSSYLNLIINEGDQLNRLVSDLLDSARLLSGKHELHLQACAINPICEAVAAEHLPVVKSGVALHIDLASDLPMINGDPVRLRQAVGNLVSNAVKFTEQGEIVIRTYSHGKSICIAVTDTGPGIPDDQQKLIFVPFVRLDHKTPGVGLGLDIALQLVRLHGGDIRLYSVLGQGSTFTIELPTL